MHGDSPLLVLNSSNMQAEFHPTSCLKDPLLMIPKEYQNLRRQRTRGNFCGHLLPIEIILWSILNDLGGCRGQVGIVLTRGWSMKMKNTDILIESDALWRLDQFSKTWSSVTNIRHCAVSHETEDILGPSVSWAIYCHDHKWVKTMRKCMNLLVNWGHWIQNVR